MRDEISELSQFTFEVTNGYPKKPSYVFTNLHRIDNHDIDSSTNSHNRKNCPLRKLGSDVNGLYLNVSIGEINF